MSVKIKTPYNLFEYTNPLPFKGKQEELDALDVFLDDIWNKRERTVLSFWGNEEKDTSQQFLRFSRKPDNLTLKSRKYVGVIKFQDRAYNLLPKIFYDGNSNINNTELQSIQSHILWWLSYCHKFKFPKSLSSFNYRKSNFFEVLIYLFANYTHEVLNRMIYQAYETVEADLYFMKGKLDVKTYLSRNYVTGNQHKLHCIFDSFEIDNQFNRIIKYVTKLLFQFTEEPDNKKLLREILFILDDVSDVKVTIYDCERVQINPLFEDMFTVLDYCKLFLSNCTVLSYKDQLKVFAFLLPMEYVFEDFVYGFMRKELKGIKVEGQKTNTYLTDKKEFQLRPDLIIEINGRKIIADTKYKMIYPFDPKESKYGISQNDLYQMLAYAIRNKANCVKVFYPSTIKSLSQEKEISFEIVDEFANKLKIRIDVYQLPVIEEGWQTISVSNALNKSFTNCRNKLLERLQSILLRD